MSLSDIVCHTSFHQYFTCIYADVFYDDDDKNNKNKIRTGALSLLESEMPVDFHSFKT
jgi:hypothetical protein